MDIVEIAGAKYILNTGQDITDRKRAEEALAIENERFRRFTESNTVGIVISDASGRIFSANDYFLKILGVTRQDLEAGRIDWESVHAARMAIGR